MNLAAFWSLEGNIVTEEGVTYPRLFELARLDESERGRAMQEHAAAVNAAMAKDPKRAVKRLDPDARRPLRNEDVPAPLRIPRKRGAEHG